MTARSAKCRSTAEAGTLWPTRFREWSNTPVLTVALTAVRARTNSALPARAAIRTASCLTGPTSMIHPIPRRVVRRAQTWAWMRSRNSRSSPRRSARNTAGLPAQWSPPLPEAARTTCTARCSNSIGTAHSMPEPFSTLKTTTVTAGPICRHSIGTNLAAFWVARLKRTRPSSSAGMKASASRAAKPRLPLSLQWPPNWESCPVCRRQIA